VESSHEAAEAGVHSRVRAFKKWKALFLNEKRSEG